MPRQLCCHGMYKSLLRYDDQEWNYSKIEIWSNLNCDGKIFSELVSCPLNTLRSKQIVCILQMKFLNAFSFIFYLWKLWSRLVHQVLVSDYSWEAMNKMFFTMWWHKSLTLVCIYRFIARAVTDVCHVIYFFFYFFLNRIQTIVKATLPNLIEKKTESIKIHLPQAIRTMAKAMAYIKPWTHILRSSCVRLEK